MTDMSTPEPVQGRIAEGGESLWVRLLFMLGYGVVSWITFWAVILLAVMQLVVLALRGKKNAQLRHFSRAMVRYLGQCLGYVILDRDAKPFPLGAFPPIAPDGETEADAAEQTEHRPRAGEEET